MKRFLLTFLSIFLFTYSAFTQQTECPRIYKQHDTLYTDPAPALQWYKNGVKIPDAVQSWFRPDTTGNYSVGSSATSGGYAFVANPTDLRIEVFDVRLKPVSDATVLVNGLTATTDANGKAFLPGVVSGRTTVKVTKDGFFDGYTAAYKPASGNAIVKIQLSALNSPFSFVDTSARMVADPSGLNITFPVNGFVYENTGAPYNGEVKVYFNHRAPENDEMFSFAMPGGDFTALNSNGETVALVSYGFFNAELRATNGEKLNLASGKVAEVSFRIPEKMRNNAPTTVPLWSFDTGVGIWKYNAELIKSGIYYKGTVSHFSSWNADYSGTSCTVIASAKDCNGNPASGVSLCLLNGVCGVTDPDGHITFANAPANTPLTLVTFQDTIQINPINAGETFTLSEPLLAGESMLAVAYFWQDTVEVLTFDEQSPVQYSLNGQNWQTSPLFTGVPFEDSVTVWIKDASGCPIKRIVNYDYSNKSNNCISHGALTDGSFIWFDSFPNHNGPIYGFKGCPTSTEQFRYVCLQYPCIISLYMASDGCSTLTTLPAEIENLSMLEGIRIENSTLEFLPPEIGNLNALASLLLGNNQLTSLPPEVGNLNALTSLDLRSNNLTTLPAEIGNLSNLTSLSLSNNQLTTLTFEIGNLIELTTLGLDHNQFTALPTEIGNLSALSKLFLNNNKLTQFPAGIGNLSALTLLDLRFNLLTSLPTDIGNFSALTKLYLNSNQLTSLPTEIGNLSSLTTLDLYANDLTSLPAEIGNLSSLTSLMLNSNDLTSLPAEIGNLSALETLYLSGNQLTTFPTDEIGNLSALTSLFLNNNQLASLSAEIGNLSVISYLDLNNNQLTSLPTEMANLADTLQTLRLKGNPIPVQDRPNYQSMLPNTSITWE